MAARHLEDLEKRLKRAHWQVAERFDGEDWRTPAWWRVTRPDGRCEFLISFLPDPEKDAQTIIDSYAAQPAPEGVPSLGFSKGRSWPEDLDAFLEALGAVFSPQSCEESEKQ